MFGGINTVGVEQYQPMRRTALAELLVGELAHDAREPTRWLSGPEYGCEETMFDRTFPRPLLGLALGKVPPGSGVEKLQLRHRGAVLLVEVCAPAGDARLQTFPVGYCGMIRGVGGHVVGGVCHG